MNEQFNNFQARVLRINRSHKRRVPYAFSVRPDGLMVPRTRSRLRFYFPWRAILSGFVTIVLVKSTMIAALGTENYELRMGSLLEGSAYQEAATTILAPDPVSSLVADGMHRAIALAETL